MQRICKKIFFICFLFSVMVSKIFSQSPMSNLRDTAFVAPLHIDNETESLVFNDEEYSYLQKSRPPGKNFIREFWEWLTQSDSKKEKKETSDADVSVHPVNFWNSDEFAGILLMFLFLVFIFSCIYFFRSGQLKKLLAGKPMSESAEFSDLQEDIRLISPEVLIQEALIQKDYRLAIRWNYISILKKLSIHSLIEFRPYKTNYDYQQELKNTSFFREFRRASRVYEFVWYGETAISEDEYTGYWAALNHFEQQIHD